MADDGKFRFSLPKIDVRQAVTFVVVAVVAFYVLRIAFGHGAEKIWGFFVELCIFMVQAWLIVSGALALQFFAQAVRANKFFDVNGAGVEMMSVQNRIGDSRKEKDGDAMACAIKYASWTIFSAVVLLAFFLMHAP